MYKSYEEGSLILPTTSSFSVGFVVPIPMFVPLLNRFVFFTHPEPVYLSVSPSSVPGGSVSADMLNSAWSNASILNVRASDLLHSYPVCMFLYQ